MLTARVGVIASAVLVAAAACSAASGEIEDDGGPGAGPTTSSVGGAGGAGGSGISVGIGGSGGAPAEFTEVFGHSGDVLYRLDPVSLQITEVGPFGNCGSGSIIDIALDEDSNLYGVKFKALYRIDRETAACTLINELPDGDEVYPTSLGFVPAGTVDPSAEALVGYQDQAYVRINLQNGTITNINLNALTAINKFSSGDIVSVKDGPTYLTVKDSNDSCNPNCPDDEIIEINPTTGVLIRNFGTIDYPEVFGIAFWGGDVFGFAREGVLFRVVFGDQSVTTNAIAFPNAPPGLEFFGAGSSTSVPLIVPR